MQGPKLAPGVLSDEVVVAAGVESEGMVDARSKWQAGHDLAWHRAETERLRVLVDFLARPVHAHGGTDPDPDIIIAYNLAVEAALQGIRRAAANPMRAAMTCRPM